jgi:hypothetical protein
MTQEMFTYQSAVSVFDGKPFVVMRYPTEPGQCTPTEARNVALGLIGAADAAEHDALVFKHLRKTGLDFEAAGLFLLELRTAREEES